jgi:transient receptor potential cation channel subfamily C member 4
MLILASQRIETVIGDWLPMQVDDEPNKRGDTPTIVEWVILAWVCGEN